MTYIPGSGGGITQLTGDVTAGPGSGSVASSVAQAVKDEIASDVEDGLSLLYAPLLHNHDGSYSAIDHTHTKSQVGLANVDNTADTAKPVSTAQQTALDLKAPLASPAFTGTPTGITKTHVGLANVDNTADAAKPVSTAQQTALDAKADKGINNSYRAILQAAASHIAGRVAGTYWLGYGNPAERTGVGTLYPPALIYIATADYPTINGITTKLRLRVQLCTNDVAPTGNYTFGLYPVTRPTTSGGAGLNIYTLGTVVPNSTILFTTPTADGLHFNASIDFPLPADGHYVIGFVSTATPVASSHLHINSILQLRNV